MFNMGSSQYLTVILGIVITVYILVAMYIFIVNIVPNHINKELIEQNFWTKLGLQIGS